MGSDTDRKASAHGKKRARSKSKSAKLNTKATSSQSATDKQLKFVPETPDMPPATKRIAAETWELYKDIIIRKYDDNYEGKALQVVRKEMEEEHGFVATNRQYIHQLGSSRGKWNVAKYNKMPNKKGTASSSTQLSDMDVSQREMLVADILFSAGYSGASLLYKKNLPPGGSNDSGPDDRSSLRRIFFSFGRATQTFNHVATAVKLVDVHINGCLQRMEGEETRDHDLWVSTFDIMVARITHDASDQATAQTPGLLEVGIGPFIKKETGELRSLSELRSEFPRLQDNRVLILFYLHLSYALIRWNDLVHPVAIEDTLRTFIDRQLDPKGAHSMIDCIRDCLNWCIETLDQTPKIPKPLDIRPGDALTAVYQIIATLWLAYVTSTPTPSWPTPTWASACETSAGISAAELIVTLVCAAMAPNLAKVSKPLDRAREGFNALDELDPRALLDRFLSQLRRTSDPRMLAPRLRPANTVTDLGKPPIFKAFLDFVAETMGIEGLAQGDAGPIVPVVLARVK